MKVTPAPTAQPADPLLIRDFVLMHWLPVVERTVRPTTFFSYRSHMVRHVLPALGNAPLRDLRPRHLNDLYAVLLGSGLSPATVLRIHATIRRALRDAVRWDLADANVAADADPPRNRGHHYTEMRTWSSNELRLFLESTVTDALHPLWFLIAMTGLRRGEALGLRWRDVDFVNRSLSVRQTFVTVGHEVQRSVPKTSRGQRVVALDTATIGVLKRHQELLNPDGPDDLLFSADGLRPFHPTAVSKRFNRLVSAAGLQRIRLHDLRHTHATLALQAGVHPKVVSERLGHTTVALTLDIYSHSNPHMQEEAAETLRNLVFGIA